MKARPWLVAVALLGSTMGAAIIDPNVTAAKARLDNATSLLQNLQSQLQNAQNTRTSLTQTQADNANWLAAQPALTQKANADVAAQKDQKPALQDKLKILTDADGDRAKAVTTDQDTLAAARAVVAQIHDSAFAAFIADDPGRTAYEPVKAARERVAQATVACQSRLEKSADFRAALADQKDAAAQLAQMRASPRSPASLAQASQEDMDASNKVEKMKTAAVENDPGVRDASKALALAVAAFKPTLDAFEADLAIRPDYAAATKDAADAQTTLAAAQAAQKQAADDQRALRRQIAILDDAGNKATAFLRTSAAETTRRTAQNASILQQLKNYDSIIPNLQQQIQNAQSNVNAYEQQYMAAQSRVGG